VVTGDWSAVRNAAIGPGAQDVDGLPQSDFSQVGSGPGNPLPCLSQGRVSGSNLNAGKRVSLGRVWAARRARLSGCGGRKLRSGALQSWSPG